MSGTLIGHMRISQQALLLHFWKKIIHEITRQLKKSIFDETLDFETFIRKVKLLKPLSLSHDCDELTATEKQIADAWCE